MTSSLNQIVDLLHVVSSVDDASLALKTSYTLYRLFIPAIQRIFTPSIDEDSEKKVVRAWLLDKLDRFADVLCGFLKDEESILRVRHFTAQK